MDLKTAIIRAKRGLREDLSLYVVATSSLAVAFLWLAGALLAVANLSEMAARWGEQRHLTVYLRDGARPADVEQLRLSLEGLPDVRTTKFVSAAEAREEFLESASLRAELGELPPEVFPASVEATLARTVTSHRTLEIAQRVKRFRAVEDVETYRGWFDRVETLLVAGRGVVLVLALLVSICVLAVVGNTIRLSVAGRRTEIEVLKLCGATDGFVRGPFLVEGAFQGVLAALLAVVFLVAGFLFLRGSLDATLGAISGTATVFLSPLVVLALIAGGAIVGVLGSALALRRYLAV